MSIFTDKNKARKDSREAAFDGGAKRGAVNDARRRRRIYGGTFGLSANHIYNELALGTSAITRNTKQAAS